MEAKSSAGHAKQIPIEEPQPQEKRRRGRKPAAAKIEKDCLAAYNLENLSADPTGCLQKQKLKFMQILQVMKHNMTNTLRFCMSNFLLNNYRNGGRILCWPGKANSN